MKTAFKGQNGKFGRSWRLVQHGGVNFFGVEFDSAITLFVHVFHEHHFYGIFIGTCPAHHWIDLKTLQLHSGLKLEKNAVSKVHKNIIFIFKNGKNQFLHQKKVRKLHFW